MQSLMLIGYGPDYTLCYIEKKAEDDAKLLGYTITLCCLPFLTITMVKHHFHLLPLSLCQTGWFSSIFSMFFSLHHHLSTLISSTKRRFFSLKSHQQHDGRANTILLSVKAAAALLASSIPLLPSQSGVSLRSLWTWTIQHLQKGNFPIPYPTPGTSPGHQPLG